MDLEENQKIGLINRLKNTGQLNKMIIFSSAAIPAILCIIFALLVIINVLHPLKIGNIILGTALDYILFAIIIFTGVYGIYQSIQK